MRGQARRAFEDFGILADHGISISVVTQKGRKENEYVPVMMLTHEAAEGRPARREGGDRQASFYRGGECAYTDRGRRLGAQRRLRPICFVARRP